MTRTKIKNKKSKAEDLDPNSDQFIKKSISFMDWAFDHRRPVALLLGITLLASVGFVAGEHYLNKNQSEASLFVAEGLEASVAPVVPPSDDAVPPKVEKNEVLTFETVKARATETLKRFDNAAEKTDSSLTSISRLGAAAAHYDLGEYKEAVAGYEAFLNNSAELEWLRPNAIEGIALALEASGKVDDARARVEALIDHSSESVANMARYQTARLALLKDDKETAVKLLKEVVATYAGDRNVSRQDYVFVRARERLMAIDPTAQAPELPPDIGAGLKGMDPRLIQQLMNARAGGGAS
jgi:hypothetical protein